MRYLPLLSLLACGTEITVRTPDGDPPKPGDGTIDDATPPKAVCQAQPNPSAPLEPVNFVGENSYDPDGNTLINYRWEIVTAPPGSTAVLPVGQANRPGFVPDMAGRWLTKLTVTDASGKQSDPCAATLDVTPAHALWLELTWEFDHEDLDLIVVRSSDTTPVDGDVCSAEGCDRDWGTPGDTTDDPELLRDDVDGTGPELIGITAPDDDRYRVYVLDRQGLLRTADNPATLTVYVNGQSQAFTKTISEEVRAETPASWVAMAEINWTTGSVTGL